MPTLNEKIQIWGAIFSVVIALIAGGVAWGATAQKVNSLERVVAGMAEAVYETREDVAFIRGHIDAIHGNDPQ
jgi:hypothetical protein